MDAVVGSLQSGALAYYAQGRIRVVNLDGVVDRSARDAIAGGTLADFARARGVTHLADWDFNLQNFDRFSTSSRNLPLRQETSIAVPMQGSDQFRLQRLAWPQGLDTTR